MPATATGSMARPRRSWNDTSSAEPRPRSSPPRNHDRTGTGVGTVTPCTTMTAGTGRSRPGEPRAHERLEPVDGLRVQGEHPDRAGHRRAVGVGVRRGRRNEPEGAGEGGSWGGEGDAQRRVVDGTGRRRRPHGADGRHREPEGVQALGLQLVGDVRCGQHGRAGDLAHLRAPFGGWRGPRRRWRRRGRSARRAGHRAATSRPTGSSCPRARGVRRSGSSCVASANRSSSRRATGMSARSLVTRTRRRTPDDGRSTADST